MAPRRAELELWWAPPHCLPAVPPVIRKLPSQGGPEVGKVMSQERDGPQPAGERLLGVVDPVQKAILVYSSL